MAKTDPAFREFLRLYGLYMKHTLGVQHHIEQPRLYRKWCSDLARWQENSLAHNYITIIDRLICSEHLNQSSPGFIIWPHILLATYKGPPQFYPELKMDLTGVPWHIQLRCTRLYAGSTRPISDRVNDAINHCNPRTPDHILEFMKGFDLYQPQEAWFVQLEIPRLLLELDPLSSLGG